MSILALQEAQENVGEKGWFFNKLMDFDKKRPYLDPAPVAIDDNTFSLENQKEKLFLTPQTGGYKLTLSSTQALQSEAVIEMFNLRGQQVSQVTRSVGSELFVSTSLLARGSYLLKLTVGKDSFTRKLSIQ